MVQSAESLRWRQLPYCFPTWPQNEMMTWKCRLLGIDTPERNSSQKQKALKARDFLVSHCIGGRFDPFAEPLTDKDIQEKLDKNRTLIWAELNDFDKYGRLLVTFKKGPRAGESFNEMLLANGFAKELKY